MSDEGKVKLMDDAAPAKFSISSMLGGLQQTRTALVVDDSMLICHTVCRFLEQNGFEVESATNGLEALDILSTIKPDIIVTDLSMPKMTGSELITEIKNRPALADTPIVVLSAKASVSQMLSENRADFVVFKDIDIDEQLLKALTAVFSRSH